MKRYTEETREAARISLGRSETCPLFLTWFSKEGQTDGEAREVIDDLIIPHANRWKRITLIANVEEVADALLTAMGHLDFEILQDLEISRLSPRLSWLALCRNAPLLRQCQLRHISSLPSTPSNLVVFDCLFVLLEEETFNLDPLLEFLPHVAHSLERLRFGPPASDILVTPRKSRITLQNLVSLLVKDSDDIMEHEFTPNLAFLPAFYPFNPDARKTAERFHGFSAPKLQSIRFDGTSLLPLIALHHLPSLFPRLESAMFEDCNHELAFIGLLRPPQPPFLQNTAKYPPKDPKVEVPFPKLKELAISDIGNWPYLWAVIECRRENGDNSLRTIHLPNGGMTGGIMRHLTQWLPKQGIKFVLYEPGELMCTPPEFQDDFCNEELRLFREIVDESE